MWQDTVIAICQLAFVPSMIPTVLGPDKPALSTSMMNAVLVGTIATTMATLSLWFATSTALLISLTWTILAVQKFRMDRRRPPTDTSGSEEAQGAATLER